MAGIVVMASVMIVVIVLFYFWKGYNNWNKLLSISSIALFILLHGASSVRPICHGAIQLFCSRLVSFRSSFTKILQSAREVGCNTNTIFIIFATLVDVSRYAVAKIGFSLLP